MWTLNHHDATWVPLLELELASHLYSSPVYKLCAESDRWWSKRASCSVIPKYGHLQGLSILRVAVFFLPSSSLCPSLPPFLLPLLCPSLPYLLFFFPFPLPPLLPLFLFFPPRASVITSKCLPFSFFSGTGWTMRKRIFALGWGRTVSSLLSFSYSGFTINFSSSPHRSRNIFYKTMFSLIYTFFHEQTKFFKGIYSASYK